MQAPRAPIGARAARRADLGDRAIAPRARRAACAPPPSRASDCPSTSGRAQCTSADGSIGRSRADSGRAEPSAHAARCGDAAPAPAPGSPPADQPLGPRRALLGAGAALAAAAAGGWAAPAARALRTVELADGSAVDAYEHGLSLSIVALRGSVPQQWVVDFRQALGRYAGFTLDQRAQLRDIFDELGTPAGGAKPRSAGGADVATLGDAWLAPAIARGLVRPIEAAETYRWWRRLPPRWQQLVRRDAATGAPAPPGAPVWACPYRWGATLVAYRPERLVGRAGGRAVLDWADLLQPRLRGRVAFPDAPREFLAVAFKSLGLPASAREADMAAAGLAREQVRERVRALRRQARLFSSRDHGRALSAGDVWAVVGWSTDLVPLAERTPSLELVAPAGGTTLWADLWAVPAHARGGHLARGPSPILPSWLEFCLMPARAGTLQGLRTGASPLLLPGLPARGARGPPRHHQHRARRRWPWQRAGGAPAPAAEPAPAPAPAAGLGREQLRLDGANNFLPPDAVLQRSEFLLPVPADTLALYAWLLDAGDGA